MFFRPSRSVIKTVLSSLSANRSLLYCPLTYYLFSMIQFHLSEYLYDLPLPAQLPPSHTSHTEFRLSFQSHLHHGIALLCLHFYFRLIICLKCLTLTLKLLPWQQSISRNSMPGKIFFFYMIYKDKAYNVFHHDLCIHYVMYVYVYDCRRKTEHLISLIPLHQTFVVKLAYRCVSCIYVLLLNLIFSNIHIKYQKEDIEFSWISNHFPYENAPLKVCGNLGILPMISMYEIIILIITLVI